MDRIRWIRNPVNRGLPYSRNRAIESTRAEWIKFLDADDVLAPFALNLIRRADPPIAPHIHVVAGGCHRIVNFVHADYLQSTAEVLQSIKLVNPLLTSAAFIRRAALLAVGMYDERIDFEEDWDMWLRLHERFGLGCFAAVTTPVCYYWIHKTERQGKRRHATIEGMPGREYFRRRYGCQPPE